MMSADSCTFKGGVRVNPCKVVLTASQPGPDTVTQQTTDTWVVTAGALAGDCHAKFNYFNNGLRVGWPSSRLKT